VQKTSKYDAAVDYEEEGGIGLEEDPLGDDEAMDEVDFKAIKPDTPPETPLSAITSGVPFPPLPTQTRMVCGIEYDVASTLGGLSLSGSTDGDESDSETVVGSPIASPTAATFPALPPIVTSQRASSAQDPVQSGFQAQDSSGPSTSNSRVVKVKVWDNHNGKSMSTTLFPNAKPNPPASEFSLSAHDQSMEKEHGINIMRTRFWDPISSDWNPEKFYDSVIGKYHCPFVCE
jgi:hypothetical protein